MKRTHEQQLQNLKRTHAEKLVILTEENDAIRDEIEDKNEKLRRYRFESEKLKRDYEGKELSYKEHLQMLDEENFRLKNENETLLNYSKDDGKSSFKVRE